jgi:hypothetical protein
VPGNLKASIPSPVGTADSQCPYAFDKVAPGSYYESMKPLKTAGVKELKNNLSSYLREVRSGATILITDRNDIVAELHEPYNRMNIDGAVHPLLMDWAEAGVVSLPAIPKEPLPLSCVQFPDGTVKELLESGRKDSRD